MTDRVEPLVSRSLGGTVIALLVVGVFLFLAVMAHVGWGPYTTVTVVALVVLVAFALIYGGARRR